MINDTKQRTEDDLAFIVRTVGNILHGYQYQCEEETEKMDEEKTDENSPISTAFYMHKLFDASCIIMH